LNLTWKSSGAFDAWVLVNSFFIKLPDAPYFQQEIIHLYPSSEDNDTMDGLQKRNEDIENSLVLLSQDNIISIPMTDPWCWYIC
jgi:hypothetical protein